MILVKPVWQAQSWYPQLLQMAVKNLSSSTKVTQSIDWYKSRKSCISRKRKLTAPAMDSFREKLSLEGLPKEYVSLITITNTRRKGTIPQLVSQERLILLNCHLKNIFDFLTDCFHEVYEFNKLQTLVQLFLFAYHDPVQAASVGQNYTASALLSGIFNNRIRQSLTLFRMLRKFRFCY